MKRYARATATRERGVALLVVIVLALVSALLALWGFRATLLNEAVVGNDADHQRAFEAAQALLQDAELDIGGQRPDGRPCSPVAGNDRICRRGGTVGFIDEDQDFLDLVNRLGAERTGCLQGVCLKRTGVQDFWNDADALAAMTADGVGARYGEYTGAATGRASHPILAQAGEGQGGWYWIEVMQYEKDSPGGGLVLGTGKDKLALRLRPSLVYRITALARGLKPGTRVVLQSTYALQAQD